ncbi:hypothetical protein [Dyadobacter sediminis]|uniref:Uncharacterized protein n=1 Tax=Dyadobacter sediminis TaxID=1493691 RepID=A0A5R9KBU4_9BACT|nr:hypothetical protein [Dyadobacter sediminis]TLU92286.1 hypothetical protein FEM55_16270 [Dyadobacter sediminis]GGB95792.1 hypothetical protein GCM10011325_23920 [Dyadobacter sediminis]
MILEKAFYVGGDRIAKITVRGKFTASCDEITLDFEFLIKEKYDTDFRQPIGENHPQYWKLKKASSGRSQLLQLEYSGISRKQLREAISAFKVQVGPGNSLAYKIPIEEKIKYLKGMRTTASSRRVSQVA